MSDDAALKCIEQAIRSLDADARPQPNWQERVISASQAGAPGGSRLPALFLLAAAALLVWFGLPGRRGYEAGFQLAVVVTPPESSRRGPATTGEMLEVRVAGQRELALWIYRDEKLILACPGSSSCRSRLDTLSVRITATTIGTYTVVALSSEKPLPPPKGPLDADVGSASSRGAEYLVEQRTVH